MDKTKSNHYPSPPLPYTFSCFFRAENVLLARQKEKLLSVKQKTVDQFYSPSKQTLLLLRRLSLIMLVSDPILHHRMMLLFNGAD